LATLRNVVYSHYVNCLPFVSTKSILVKPKLYLISNPSFGKVTINQQYADDISGVTILDSKGKIISLKEHEALSSGFYLVVIHLKNETIVYEKLVVNRY
jgi:hypothetical protein